MTDVKEHEKIMKGQMAIGAKTTLTPIFDKQREKLIDDLKGAYRQNDLNGQKYIAIAAALCSIDDMENNINGLVKRGNRATEGIEHDRN